MHKDQLPGRVDLYDLPNEYPCNLPPGQRCREAKTPLYLSIRPTSEFMVQEVSLYMWDGNDSGFSDCSFKCHGTIREAARTATLRASQALRMLQKHGLPPEIAEAAKVVREYILKHELRHES